MSVALPLQTTCSMDRLTFSQTLEEPETNSLHLGGGHTLNV